MKYEVLKRSHLKRNILIAVLVVALISSLILNFTQAKYRVTESMPLIQGTINFSPSDLNLMAVYLNKNGETISSDKVPHVGYTLNTEQSLCEVNDEKDETIEIVYENSLLNFNGLGNKGTKCTAYFDLIPDSENPIINNITTVSDETSITVTVDASDNIGVFYYYFQLDNGEEVRNEENTYTFENLNERQEYTVNVRVEDAVGNEDIDNKDVIVGYRTADVILASANPPTGQTTDWTGGISYYYTGDPNNWIQFGGFYWRIIRINGDGSIRMIYQGTSANATGIGTQIGTSAFNTSDDNNMYVGYMYGSNSSDYNITHANTYNSTIKGVLDNWYTNNITNKGYGDYVDGYAGFCGDRRVSSGSGVGTSDTYYQSYRRMQNSSPSLSCEDADIYTASGSNSGNKALIHPVGLISADEAMLAGMPDGSSGVSGDNTNNFLYTGEFYWTMSPSWNQSGHARVSYLTSYCGINDNNNFYYVSDILGVRPVINLRSDVEITGSGTSTDPFRVVGA